MRIFPECERIIVQKYGEINRKTKIENTNIELNIFFTNKMDICIINIAFRRFCFYEKMDIGSTVI